MALWLNIIDTLPRALEAEEIAQGTKTARVTLIFTPAKPRPYKVTVTLHDAGQLVDAFEQTYTREFHHKARAAVRTVKTRVTRWLNGAPLSEVRPPMWK